MEKEMLEELRDLSYETGHIAGRAESGMTMSVAGRKHQQSVIAERNALLEAIAAQHEAEVAEQELQWKKKWAEEIAARQEAYAVLQAQMAVMGEALRDIKDVVEPSIHLSHNDQNVWNIALDGLSAAPKVVYHTTGTADRDGAEIGSAVNSTLCYIVFPPGDALEIEEKGEPVEVYVMKRPRPHEQAQSSEQEATDEAD